MKARVEIALFVLAVFAFATVPQVALAFLLPAQGLLEVFVRIVGFMGWGWLVGQWAARIAIWRVRKLREELDRLERERDRP